MMNPMSIENSHRQPEVVAQEGEKVEAEADAAWALQMMGIEKTLEDKDEVGELAAQKNSKNRGNDLIKNVPWDLNLAA